MIRVLDPEYKAEITLPCGDRVFYARNSIGVQRGNLRQIATYSRPEPRGYSGGYSGYPRAPLGLLVLEMPFVVAHKAMRLLRTFGLGSK